MHGYFHHKLEDLKRLLLRMSGLVENQLFRAERALFEADRAGAQHVIALDPDVDALELRVDAMCIQLLALHQPAAGDLRFIAAAMKVVTDLERIGDQAVNVARAALEGPPPAGLLDTGLKPMAELARNMVSESARALARADPALARKVIAGDAAVDLLERQAVGELLAHAAREPALLRSVLQLAQVARSLERVGDHATNVAEMVLYVAEGLFERHAAEPRPRPGGRRVPGPLRASP